MQHEQFEHQNAATMQKSMESKRFEFQNVANNLDMAVSSSKPQIARKTDKTEDLQKKNGKNPEISPDLNAKALAMLDLHPVAVQVIPFVAQRLNFRAAEQANTPVAADPARLEKFQFDALRWKKKIRAASVVMFRVDVSCPAI